MPRRYQCLALCSNIWRCLIVGYTHYFYARKELDKDTFKNITNDFKKIMPVLEHLGVMLAGPHGDGEPILTDTEIAFNGLAKCGHTERELGITWPAKEAQGVARLDMQHRSGNETQAGVNGHWFAGAELDTRTCDGNCSHETFSLVQQMNDIPEHRQEEAKQNKRIFDCTKTAYKPYDLAVTACLIIAKHYLGNEIIISSDGELPQWKDAIGITEHFLNYGHDFKLEDIAEIEKLEEQAKPKPEVKRIDKTKPVEVGDIFERSWGYDQTNVDFYKVIALTKSAKSAKVIKIGQKMVKQTGDMSELVEPDPSNITGEKPQTLRIKQYQSDSSIYIGNLWRWDGTPCHQSHYA